MSRTKAQTATGRSWRRNRERFIMIGEMVINSIATSVPLRPSHLRKKIGRTTSAIPSRAGESLPV